jgi:hypothetical protein
MSRQKTSPDQLADARRLALTDTELAHLRHAVESCLRDPKLALPLSYWRQRLEKLASEVSLLPHQDRQIKELLNRLSSERAS